MSDPLLDPRDQELESELLRAGRDVRLSAAAQARILTSLGVAAGGLTVAGKAAATTGGTLAKLSSLVSGKSVWLAAGLVSVGAIGGGAWYAGSVGAEPPVAPRVVEAPVKATQGRAVRKGEATEPEAAPKSSPEVTPATPEPNKAHSQAPSTGDRPQPTLGDELAVVESASRALRSGNPQAALGRLAEYRQRFPRGKLALEAQVLRIEALARAGRSGEAARLARGFLKRHPNSPVAARIRRYAE